MSKKQKRGYAPAPARPLQFRDFAECVHWLRHGVFVIVRGRELQPGNVQWITCGTGFLANKGRMVTAAHLFENPVDPNPLAQHQDTDTYYLIRNDHEGDVFGTILVFTKNQTLFLDVAIDAAVLYLPDQFYADGNKVLNNSSSFFRIAPQRFSIGTEVGVFGYPLAQLTFENRDVRQPKVGEMVLRVDRGVINAGFDVPSIGRMYEFTMAFNPGNSGGPIVDVRSGRFISIVKGFRSFTVAVTEKDVPPGLTLKKYTEQSYLDSAVATYSSGVATVSSAGFLAQHGIVP
jgi:Trypsin-like peptidase domain